MQATMQCDVIPDASGERPLAYTAGQAAKAAGVSTATISRALKRGTISGSKQPDGSWRIEAAELHRIFQPLAAQEPERAFMRSAAIVTQEPERAEEERARQGELAALRDALVDARNDRDKWREMAERLAIAPPQQMQMPSRSLWQRILERFDRQQ